METTLSKELFTKNKLVFIEGHRNAGKTTLLKQVATLFESRVLYVYSADSDKQVFDSPHNADLLYVGQPTATSSYSKHAIRQIIHQYELHQQSYTAILIDVPSIHSTEIETLSSLIDIPIVVAEQYLSKQRKEKSLYIDLNSRQQRIEKVHELYTLCKPQH